MISTIALLAVSVAPFSADTCATSSLIPAYAHNDYRNRRPLTDALELGFRGVEADVFRVGAELLVGHERRALRPGNTLSRLYLEPLRARLRACGRILPDGAPFFLNVELKDADTTAFRHLLAALRDYEDLFPAIHVTLVGWWPVNNAFAWPDYLRVQLVVERGRVPMAATDRPVGLISVDYGKVLGWRGSGEVPLTDRTTLLEIRELADRVGVPVRVHHAPSDSRIYKWLLSEKVTLIGATDLRRTRTLLAEIP